MDSFDRIAPNQTSSRRRSRVWTASVVAAMLVLGGVPAQAQSQNDGAGNTSEDQELDLAMGAFDGLNTLGPLVLPSESFRPSLGHSGPQPFDQQPPCIPGKNQRCP